MSKKERLEARISLEDKDLITRVSKKYSLSIADLVMKAVKEQYKDDIMESESYVKIVGFNKELNEPQKLEDLKIQVYTSNNNGNETLVYSYESGTIKSVSVGIGFDEFILNMVGVEEFEGINISSIIKKGEEMYIKLIADNY